MSNELFLYLKSCLYQIYIYTIDHPKTVFAVMVSWFVICSFMEWWGSKKERKNILYAIWKILVFCVMAGCTIILLYVTIGYRTQYAEMKYKAVIFWSYREVIFNHSQFILWQIIWNIVAFVPVGNALYYVLESKRRLYKVVAICGIFSLGIELSQLIFRIGLFEFDDIFHNTLGAVIGYLIARIGCRILNYVTDFRKKHFIKFQ